MKPCCVPVLLQYGWEQGPSSLKVLEGFPFLVEVRWTLCFCLWLLILGGFGCFCVCAVWLQFASCIKKFSDQVRLALHRGCLARGTAAPFAKKKGFYCIGVHFSWKISMKTAGKSFPAIQGKFASSFFFPSSIFGGVVGLIGCFSFGFFMLVLYFIWQWGLTALLEIEFIFPTALICL